jgi:SAM-dependent methyltransferase
MVNSPAPRTDPWWNMSDSGNMSSPSARTSGQRPFYAAHADAYDLLVTDPVEPWTEAVHERLTAPPQPPRAGSPTPADQLERTDQVTTTILDAGCGTGRHAAALIAKGHRVDLADASAPLLAIARRRCPAARAYLADLCNLEIPTRYDAVTCRGVLNDMVTDRERSAAIRALAKVVAPGGLLLLDVREENASRERADGVTRDRTVALDPDTHLTFTARTTWTDGLLHVHERYSLTGRQPVTYEFTMRPWSEAELRHHLQEAGLRQIETRPGVGRKTSDRLFVIAS